MAQELQRGPSALLQQDDVILQFLQRLADPREARAEVGDSVVPSVKYGVQSSDSKVTWQGVGQRLGCTCHVLVRRGVGARSEAPEEGGVEPAPLTVPKDGSVVSEEPYKGGEWCVLSKRKGEAS